MIKIYWNGLRFQISSLVHIKMSPDLRESKTVLDSGFNALESGCQVPLDLGLCQWNLDCGFQS